MTAFRLALTIKWKTSNPTRQLTTIQNKVFAYARVSTQKQGERGVSLQEQREAIERYAERTGLVICEWFEERETAAKRGRPVFATMMSRLRKGVARGVVIHKIDRSARNLRDWADLGELIDRGIQVHFANESLDLHSRGGRLSADIQAVIAADYIRNLREEVRKGFYGRLKQGLYPLPAPLGYKNMGAGKPKVLNPKTAPLVKRAFELYGTGQHSLDSLSKEMEQRGLRTRRGRRASPNALSLILRNPFYSGVIRIERTKECFPGAHEPLVSKALFDRVQRILDGKLNRPSYSHDFLFRRLLKCAECGYSLIGERQKGHVYYRCHTQGCPTTGIREELVHQAVGEVFDALRFSGAELRFLNAKLTQLAEQSDQDKATKKSSLGLRLSQLQERLDRLTDAFVDGVLESELFAHRKTDLLMEKRDIEKALATLEHDNPNAPRRLAKFLELAGSLYSTYQTAEMAEKRRLIEIATSNRRVRGKSLEFMLSEPFREIAKRHNSSDGGPSWDCPRTWGRLLPHLVSTCTTMPADWLASLDVTTPEE